MRLSFVRSQSLYSTTTYVTSVCQDGSLFVADVVRTFIKHKRRSLVSNLKTS
jgi:hypothetical protein